MHSIHTHLGVDGLNRCAVGVAKLSFTMTWTLKPGPPLQLSRLLLPEVDRSARPQPLLTAVTLSMA